MLGKALLSASVSAPPAVYVEDVFSTWLYTGNGSTQTITNGIDLAGKGGLVWLKNRNFTGGLDHFLHDSARGFNKYIRSNTTDPQLTDATQVVASSTGFTVGSNGNISPYLYASWTFRKAAKFFDVVTYTGTGLAQAISHALGSVPGFIVAKRTDNISDWIVYHRSRGATKVLTLNSTGAEFTAGHWDNTTPTSTQFYVGGGGVSNNTSGGTYVAYLFAHDAGGFGDTGSDNVVSCGSFTTDGSGNATVNLGWEPQWVLMKKTNATGQSWILLDSMRGTPLTGNSAYLSPNANSSEFADFGLLIKPNATGFTSTIVGESSSSYIYIAIRRGPMKTPTDATKVFDVDAYTTNNSSSQVISVGFPADMVFGRERTTTGNLASQWLLGTRLLGNGYLNISQASPETVNTAMVNGWDDQNSIDLAGIMVGNGTLTEILYSFRRAPGFFEVVTYTGTDTVRTVAHNLGVTPELLIVKTRSGSRFFATYNSTVGNTKAVFLNLDNSAVTNSVYWNNTSPTSSVFTLGSGGVDTNTNGANYIAYLFATLTGISKVGSYTGTGTTLNVDCGFTAGARFVLIKRTDSSGDWYVWDTARGIISGNDPYLLLNSLAAEVTSTDYIDPLSSGFQISSTAPAAINANGGSFIFLAIA